MLSWQWCPKSILSASLIVLQFLVSVSPFQRQWMYSAIFSNWLIFFGLGKWLRSYLRFSTPKHGKIGLKNGTLGVVSEWKKNCSKFWENLEKNVHFWEFNVLGRKTYERWHCCSIGLAQAALGFSGLLQIYRDSSKPLRETLAPRWGLLRALQSSSRLLELLRGSSGLLGAFLDSSGNLGASQG